MSAHMIFLVVWLCMCASFITFTCVKVWKGQQPVRERLAAHKAEFESRMRELDFQRELDRCSQQDQAYITYYRNFGLWEEYPSFASYAEHLAVEAAHQRRIEKARRVARIADKQQDEQLVAQQRALAAKRREVSREVGRLHDKYVKRDTIRYVRAATEYLDWKDY